MPTYKFNGQIAEDHTLELPHDIPTGWAEIVVTTEAGRGTHAAIDAVLRDIVQGNLLVRSKEEIDANLRTEREGWE